MDLPPMTRSAGSSGFSRYESGVGYSFISSYSALSEYIDTKNDEIKADIALWGRASQYERNRQVKRLTTSLSYTSTALCVAVATGYSCRSSNDPWGSVSSNVEGTISGSSPYAQHE